MTFIRFIMLFALFIGTKCLYAQQACTSSGAKSIGSGGTATYVVGQVVYNHYITEDKHLDQGILHPYEISIQTGIENDDVKLDMVAYPNPASDYLRLQWKDDNMKISDVAVKIYSIEGNLLMQRNTSTNPEQIVMTAYPKGTYLLQFIYKNELIKTFKIIKN